MWRVLTTGGRAGLALVVLLIPATALPQPNVVDGNARHGFGAVNPGDCELRLKLDDDEQWGGQLFIDGLLAAAVRQNRKGDRLLLDSPVRPLQTLQISVTSPSGTKDLAPLGIKRAVDVWPDFPRCRLPSDERPSIDVTFDYGYLNNTFAGIDPGTAAGEAYRDPGDPLRIPASATIQPFVAPRLSWRVFDTRRLRGLGLFIEADTQLGAAGATCQQDDNPCELDPKVQKDFDKVFANARTAEFSGGARFEFGTVGPDGFRHRYFLRTTFNRAIFAGTDLKARSHFRPITVGIRAIDGRLRDSSFEAGLWANNELITADNEAKSNRRWFAAQVLYSPSKVPVPELLRKFWPATRVLIRVESDFAKGRDWFRFTFGFNTHIGGLGALSR